ncbi:hypothetical protein [Deinococcus ruber]|uniref:hypothetical protein n=1 Tax=Deinococcus ruber TaxID=1848197 RepID=UPI001665E12B|nr:hypothetical protein [Deinococcus ruber]
MIFAEGQGGLLATPASLLGALALMDYGYHRVAVVDEDGRLVEEWCGQERRHRLHAEASLFVEPLPVQQEPDFPALPLDHLDELVRDTAGDDALPERLDEEGAQERPPLPVFKARFSGAAPGSPGSAPG